MGLHSITACDTILAFPSERCYNNHMVSLSDVKNMLIGNYKGRIPNELSESELEKYAAQVYKCLTDFEKTPKDLWQIIFENDPDKRYADSETAQVYVFKDALKLLKPSKQKADRIFDYFEKSKDYCVLDSLTALFPFLSGSQRLRISDIVRERFLDLPDPSAKFWLNYKEQL